jgi:acyl carrier protein phosphodiesterase
VVRDPVTRFESFYWGNKYGEEGDINRYVRRGRINEAMRHDIHAVPQTTLLGNTLSDFDFVGHTENMDEVAKVLSEAANRKVKIPHLNASPIERVPTLAATRRRLRTLYRRDMRTFGYV